MADLDPLAIAVNVAVDPAKVHTVATNDLVAICRAFVEASQRPQISDELAAAARQLIASRKSLERARTAVLGGHHTHLAVQVEHFNDAAAAFQSAFEEEFPDV